MVSHFIQVGYEDYTSEITIQEDDKDCVLIIDDSKTKTEAYLTIAQLHDFIGTLLHVQQKLKNK